MSDDDDGANVGMAVVKGAIFALGTVAAIGIGLALLKPLVLIGVLGGAGYVGYRLVNRSKALPSGKQRRALPSSDDFDRRMAELDKMERKLDAEIRKG